MTQEGTWEIVWLRDSDSPALEGEWDWHQFSDLWSSFPRYHGWYERGEVQLELRPLRIEPIPRGPADMDFAETWRMLEEAAAKAKEQQ